MWIHCTGSLLNRFRFGCSWGQFCVYAIDWKWKNMNRMKCGTHWSKYWQQKCSCGTFHVAPSLWIEISVSNRKQNGWKIAALLHKSRRSNNRKNAKIMEENDEKLDELKRCLYYKNQSNSLDDPYRWISVNFDIYTLLAAVFKCNRLNESPHLPAVRTIVNGTLKSTAVIINHWTCVNLMRFYDCVSVFYSLDIFPPD